MVRPSYHTASDGSLVYPIATFHEDPLAHNDSVEEDRRLEIKLGGSMTLRLSYGARPAMPVGASWPGPAARHVGLDRHVPGGGARHPQ
jgi:hypothetical protein